MSVNVKPRRSAPKTATAVSPAGAPGLRIVAVHCEIDRPARNTVTSISTGPACTGAANTALMLRSACSS